MNYRTRIKYVLNSIVKKDAQSFTFVAERSHKTAYESAWRLPPDLSYKHIKRLWDVLSASCGAPVELDDRGGVVIVRVVTEDLQKEIPFNPNHLVKDKLLIGYNRLREPVYHPFLTHLLAGGAAGAGKTDWLRFIVYQLILMGYDVRIVDMKGFSFMPFDTIPGLTVARNVDEAAALLKEAYTELENREKAVIEHRNRDLIQTFQPMAIIIDEAAQIAPSQNTGDDKTTAKECDKYCARIAQKGREPRVQLIYCTQRPDKDIINAQVKANVEAAVAFRCKTMVNSEIILDRPGAEKISPDTPGRCIYSGVKDVLVQVPYIGNDDAWNTLLMPLKTEVVEPGSSARVSKRPIYGPDGDNSPTLHAAGQLQPVKEGERNVAAVGAKWTRGTHTSGEYAKGMAAQSKRAETDGDEYDVTFE